MSVVPPPSLELRVFGVPVAVVDGLETRMTLKRALALIIYLAFNGEPVPRSHLAAVLWPDVAEPHARTRLRRLIYAIDELAHGLISTADDCLSLAVLDVTVDALAYADFARRVIESAALDDATLARAQCWLEQRRRRLLQGLDFGSPSFDDWVHAQTIDLDHLSARLIERVIEALGERQKFDVAARLAEELIALDVFREGSYVLLMRLHALQGHAAGVESAYARCAEVLRAEFGIPPGPSTEKAYLRMSEDLRRLSSHRIERPRIRFAESGRGPVAYTVLGSGPQTLVLAPGFVSHIEIGLELAAFRESVEALAHRFQVILFDRRGVGLSERLGVTSTPASTAVDIASILDHASVSRAWIFGSSEGGLGAMRLALDRPDRVEGLCLFGALARGSAAPDYPWALPAAAYDVWLSRLVAGWGGPAGLETFAPSEKDDPTLQAWWARILRHAASPGALKIILAGLRDADLRGELARIVVPTLVMHRRKDRAVRFEAGNHLAQSIPGATWAPLEGADHFWWCGDPAQVIDEVLHFTGGIAKGPSLLRTARTISQAGR